MTVSPPRRLTVDRLVIPVFDMLSGPSNRPQEVDKALVGQLANLGRVHPGARVLCTPTSLPREAGSLIHGTHGAHGILSIASAAKPGVVTLLPWSLTSS